VEAVVDDIPPGRVMTYGDVAGCCGHPGAARRVGAIAHDGSPGLPWHRVVRAHGLLAQIEGSPAQWQVEHLAAEGVPVVDGRIVDFSRVRWHPELEVTTN
jgi:methylated-DNA-protein-cysteine methyltransferase-like protein